MADDSPTIQRVIELTFADQDFDVVCVSDGQTATERIEADPPDIVLADVEMPECSGYDVSAFVKDRPELQHIPVVLLTGAFEPIDEARAQAVRCDGVLAKPFEPEAVVAKVRTLVMRSAEAEAKPDGPAIDPSIADESAPTPAASPSPTDLAADAVPTTAAHDDSTTSPPTESAGGEENESVDEYLDRLDAAFATLGSAGAGQAAPGEPALDASTEPTAQPDVPIEPVPQEEVPAEPVPQLDAPIEPVPEDVPAEPVPQLDVPAESVSQVEVPIEPVPQLEVPIEPVPQLEVPIEPVPQLEVPIEPVPQLEVPTEPVLQVEVPAEPVLQVDVPTEPVPQLEVLALPDVVQQSSESSAPTQSAAFETPAPHAPVAGSVADAFGSLLAEEQGESPAANDEQPTQLSTGTGAALDDEALDRLASQVSDRLGDRVGQPSEGPPSLPEEMIDELARRVSERISQQAVQ